MVLYKNLKFVGAGFTLGLLTFVAYYPITDAGSIIDDAKFYINDPVMLMPDGWISIWLKPFENNGIWSYVPISRTTFWLERQIWGLNLSVSHWLNVVFHGLNAFLLWQVLKQLQMSGAWIVGMCFALHPIHVQSVAWIAERRNVISGVFFLLTLLGYIRFEKERTYRWYGITLGLYLCALLSKVSTIMLPFLFIFYHLWRSSSWHKSDTLRLIPFFTLALGGGFLRVWFELHSIGVISQISERSFLERLLTAGHTPFFYLSKIVFPDPLIFTYPKWNIDPTQASFYFPVFSVILTMGILFWKYSSWGKAIFLSLGIFGVLLFPVLGFFSISWTQFSFVTDHWVYLPSIPLFIFLVQGTLKIIKELSFQNTMIYQRVVIIIPAVYGAILIIMTWNQVLIYKDNNILWQTTLTNNPNSWLAYGELGLDYSRKHQNIQALDNYNKALSLNPGYSQAYSNRGNLFLRLHQNKKALEDYNESLRLKPNAKGFINRGNLFLSLSQYQQALEDYNRAVQFQPRFAEAYYSRGLVYVYLQQYHQALDDYSKAIALQPDFAKFYYSRGITYSQLQQDEQALADYHKTIELQPDYQGIYYYRANTYFKLGQYQQALEDYNRSLRAHPHVAETYYNRGEVYAALKQFKLAIKDFNKVLELNPDHAASYNRRGLLHEVMKNKNLACSDWQAACRLGQCQYYSQAKAQADCP